MQGQSRIQQHIDTLRQESAADVAVEDLFGRLREMARDRDEALAAVGEWKARADDADHRTALAEQHIDRLEQQALLVGDLIDGLRRRIEAAQKQNSALAHRIWFLEGTLRVLHECYQGGTATLPDEAALLLVASFSPSQVANGDDERAAPPPLTPGEAGQATPPALRAV